MADASSAREQAEEILSGSRYQDTDLPRPFEQPLNWLDDRLDDFGNWLAGGFDDVDASLPGGEVVVWLLLIVVVGLISVALARSAVRRTAIAGYGRDGAPGVARVDPRELERRADAAERAGDFETAVRLRFEAGVLRLDLEPGVLRTTGEIRAALESERFDAIGAEHDEIAYGGRPAEPRDASSSREGWAAVLEESRR